MQVCCAGEVMLELAPADDAGTCLRGVAGDTFNTAVYLARAGLQVSYLTRLGDDPLSDAILARLAAEGIATDLIGRDAGGQPGLYLIDNDASGERRFYYWREQSPARRTFDRPLAVGTPDLFYFSGITLAVTRSGHAGLLSLLAQLRDGGTRIAFDSNYRPHLWEDITQARQHYAAVLPLCDIALPGLDDERALWGVETVDDCRALLASHGIGEVAIKGPDLTVHAWAGEAAASARATPVNAVDTTGAGDAFNAGYLAARLQGAALATAIERGQHLAAQVVQQRGAILPRPQE